MGLIKLTNVPDALQRWIATLATSEGKKIPDYVIGFLKKNLPRTIQAPQDYETELESPHESGQSAVRRSPQKDVGESTAENLRDKTRKKGDGKTA